MNILVWARKTVCRKSTALLIIVSVITLGGALSAVLAAKAFPRQAYRALSTLKLTNTNSQHYQIVEGSIVSGDTFRVSDGKKELGIQLCGINAPESKQSLGTESRDHLRSLISQGDGQVILVAAGTDRAGRTIAEAFIPTGSEDGLEIHLNSQMLADGMAYLASEFVDTCSNGHTFPFAEDMAKDKTVGIWANPENIWDDKASKH